jgi:hypothetical protein
MHTRRCCKDASKTIAHKFDPIDAEVCALVDRSTLIISGTRNGGSLNSARPAATAAHCTARSAGYKAPFYGGSWGEEAHRKRKKGPMRQQGQTCASAHQRRK